MKSLQSNSGFSVIEFFLIAVVVGIIGFVGLTVVNSNKTADGSDKSQTQTRVNNDPSANDVKSAPEITTASDLDKSITVLDQTDPEGSNSEDGNSLSSQTATF